MVAETKKKNGSYSIEMTPDALVVVDKIAKSLRFGKGEAVAKYLDWLGKMPRNFVEAILLDDDETRDDLLLQWAREQLSFRGHTAEADLKDRSVKMNLIRKLMNEIMLETEPPKKKG